MARRIWRPSLRTATSRRKRRRSNGLSVEALCVFLKSVVGKQRQVASAHIRGDAWVTHESISLRTGRNLGRPALVRMVTVFDPADSIPHRKDGERVRCNG